MLISAAITEAEANEVWVGAAVVHGSIGIRIVVGSMPCGLEPHPVQHQDRAHCESWNKKFVRKSL